MSNRQAIEDILEYDSIYRSDAIDYARFRRYFLERGMKTLNKKYRENAYLPIRILLLETSRKHIRHGLNDLWMMMHMTRQKGNDVKEVAQQEVDLTVWHQMSEPIETPGAVSDLHFSPVVHDYFAFSTIDGALHFGKVGKGLKLDIVATVRVPSVSFLKFKWVSQNLIVGLGFTMSAFLMSSDAHLWELKMPSEPSEIDSYDGIENSIIVGERSGDVLMFDLRKIVRNVGTAIEFKKPTSATISKAETEICRVYSLRKPISAMSVPDKGNCIAVGTSDGEIHIIGVEVKKIQKWRKAKTELKMTSVQVVAISIKDLKQVSIDSIAAMMLGGKFHMFVNTRSENGTLFVSDDIANNCHVVKEFRVPSLRAKCPVDINSIDNQWLWVAGTDMGDVIVGAKGEDVAILALHDSSISVVQWVPHSRVFISADVAGRLTMWTRS